MSKDKAYIQALLNNYTYRWGLHARDKQTLPKSSFFIWLILAGRGFGKTRTGAETIRQWIDNYPIVGLVAPTAGDARDKMIEGESGLLNVFPPWSRPKYEPSKKRIVFSNGARAEVFSADEPDRIRGANLYKAWGDEVSSWRYPEAWDMLKLAVRLGDNPQIVVTTTPKPNKLTKQLVKASNVYITKGTTYENKANLSSKFFEEVVDLYEGTRLGRQEISGELLEDIEGALWTNELIKHIPRGELPELSSIVVAIDPAVTSSKDSDETGIVVVGVDKNRIGYVLADASGIYTPNGWASTAIKLFDKWEADKIIGEANNGGDLIEEVLRGIDRTVSYSKVWASRGKVTRAEPVVNLYERGKVLHLGNLVELETELTTWDAKSGEVSPNRLDALVWGLSWLMLKKGASGNFYAN